MQIYRHILCAAASTLALFVSACGNFPQYVRFSGFAQGGTYGIVCELPDPYAAGRIADSIDTLLLEIDNSLSGYNRGSILSRINGGEDIPLDGHFLRVMEISREMHRESGGAFDPSAGPLFDLWGFGFTTGDEVSREAVDSVMQFVGMDHFSLDTLEDGTIHLRKDDPRCRLNFNAVAQGYTCDAAGNLLRREGCRNFLVEIGGEILCAGVNPKGEKWAVGVEKPEAEEPGGIGDGERLLKDTLRVTDCAVVTSGNYRKHNDKGGRSRGHIIDPRTGMPTEEILRSETVIVPCAESDYPCAVADARATVKCIGE